jgi:hypothetical protein
MDYKQLFCIKVLKDGVPANSSQNGAFKRSIFIFMAGLKTIAM